MIENSTNDRTKAIVLDFLDAVNAKDKERFIALLHDDVVYDFRHEGHATCHGKEATIAGWDAMLQTLPDIHEAVTEVLVRDDLAIVYWDMSGSLSGPLPLGKGQFALPDAPQPRVTTSGLDIFLIKDGLVIRKDTLLDIGIWFDAFAAIRKAALPIGRWH